MRFSIILLAVGLVLASVCPACSNRNARPSFTEQEAKEKVGERLRCIRGLDDHPPALVARLACEVYTKTGEALEYTNVGGVTLCEKTGKCVNLKKGDLGTVVGIEEVSGGGYFLRVHWDLHQECEPNVSYVSKPVYRILFEKI